MVIRHTFPLDAEYELQVGQAGGGRLGGPAAAGPRTDDLYVTIDGVRVRAAGAWRHAAARVRPGRTPSRRRASCATIPAVPTASITSRRARRASPSSRSPAPSTPPAPAIRPAGAGCSSARRRRRLTSLTLRAVDSLDAGDARVPAARSPPPAPSSTRRSSSIGRARQRILRVRHRARGGARPRRSAVPLPVRARAGERRGRHRLPHLGSRAGVAAVVLSLEQHPGRRAAVGRRQGGTERPRHARAAGAADAGRSEGRRAGDELRRAVALPPRAAERPPRFARLRRQPPAVVPARDRAAVPHHPARGPQHRRSARRGLHVRGRTARRALRHPRRARLADAAGRSSRPTARAAACSDTAAS